MEVDPKFLAPCGLYCGVCGVYYATRDENEKFLDKLLKVYQGGIPQLDELTTEDLLARRKSVLDQVVNDSDPDEEFACSFEMGGDVRVCAKLPRWFRIDTPLGTYHPAWAALVKSDDQQKLYFFGEPQVPLNRTAPPANGRDSRRKMRVALESGRSIP